jgi:hypothetical protein
MHSFCVLGREYYFSDMFSHSALPPGRIGNMVGSGSYLLLSPPCTAPKCGFSFYLGPTIDLNLYIYILSIFLLLSLLKSIEIRFFFSFFFDKLN